MWQNKWWFIVLALVVVLPLLWLFIQARLATRPSNLGPQQGRLRGCPPSPNCVSTEAETPEHQAEPLPYAGTAEQAMEDIRTVLDAMSSVRIVTQRENYLHAEFTSAVFGFVDDVEFLVEPRRQVVHFRSASRVGYSDLGANRQRMERFAQEFTRFQESKAETPGAGTSQSPPSAPSPPSPTPSSSTPSSSTPSSSTPSSSTQEEDS